MCLVIGSCRGLDDQVYNFCLCVVIVIGYWVFGDE